MIQNPKTYRRRLTTNLKVRGKKDTRHPDVIAMEMLRDQWNAIHNATLDAQNAEENEKELHQAFLDAAKDKYQQTLIGVMENQDGLDPERFPDPNASRP